jgi:hypothetical protein
MVAAIASVAACTWLFPASMHGTGTERCSSQLPLSQKAWTNSDNAGLLGHEWVVESALLGGRTHALQRARHGPLRVCHHHHRAALSAPDHTTAARGEQLHAPVLRCCTVIEGSASSTQSSAHRKHYCKSGSKRRRSPSGLSRVSHPASKAAASKRRRPA